MLLHNSAFSNQPPSDLQPLLPRPPPAPTVDDKTKFFARETLRRKRNIVRAQQKLKKEEEQKRQEILLARKEWIKKQSDLLHSRYQSTTSNLSNQKEANQSLHSPVNDTINTAKYIVEDVKLFNNTVAPNVDHPALEHNPDFEHDDIENDEVLNQIDYFRNSKNRPLTGTIVNHYARTVQQGTRTLRVMHASQVEVFDTNDQNADEHSFSRPLSSYSTRPNTANSSHNVVIHSYATAFSEAQQHSRSRSCFSSMDERDPMLSQTTSHSPLISGSQTDLDMTEPYTPASNTIGSNHAISNSKSKLSSLMKDLESWTVHSNRTDTPSHSEVNPTRIDSSASLTEPNGKGDTPPRWRSEERLVPLSPLRSSSRMTDNQPHASITSASKIPSSSNESAPATIGRNDQRCEIENKLKVDLKLKDNLKEFLEIEKYCHLSSNSVPPLSLKPSPKSSDTSNRHVLQPPQTNTQFFESDNLHISRSQGNSEFKYNEFRPQPASSLPVPRPPLYAPRDRPKSVSHNTGSAVNNRQEGTQVLPTKILLPTSKKSNQTTQPLSDVSTPVHLPSFPPLPSTSTHSDTSQGVISFPRPPSSKPNPTARNSNKFRSKFIAPSPLPETRDPSNNVTSTNSDKNFGRAKSRSTEHKQKGIPSSIHDTGTLRGALSPVVSDPPILPLNSRLIQSSDAATCIQNSSVFPQLPLLSFNSPMPPPQSSLFSILHSFSSARFESSQIEVDESQILKNIEQLDRLIFAKVETLKKLFSRWNGGGGITANLRVNSGKCGKR
ncbi:hypothetical protein BKA69DRAFT_1169170 [Paraphysoderma sedebokerense]|nr:hypothetical protein BKA69DRAFT_1169170 [Paraphysoderma sedebokerense]